MRVAKHVLPNKLGNKAFVTQLMRVTESRQTCQNTGFRETRRPELGNKRLLPSWCG